jgi:hypothetical protein
MHVVGIVRIHSLMIMQADYETEEKHGSYPVTPVWDGDIDVAARAHSHNGEQWPVGTGTAVLCPPDQMQEQAGQSHCEPCPSGRYYPGAGASASIPCPAGYYSPQGPDHYCSSPGRTAPGGPCLPGYFCPGGQGFPSDARCSTSGERLCASVCPIGAFGEEGSSRPVACPAGTYTVGVGVTSSVRVACLPCPQGKFCAASIDSDFQSASSVVAKDNHCDPGFVSNPTDGETGHACSPGKHCPAGTVVEMDCPRGFFAASVPGKPVPHSAYQEAEGKRAIKDGGPAREFATAHFGPNPSLVHPPHDTLVVTLSLAMPSRL